MSGDQLGPYRLESLVGRGGMGQVWHAHDTRHDDRDVALKVLTAALAADPDYRARFHNEAARAAKLVSPHIIPIHSYGEADGQLYIEMPLATGTDLDDLVDGHGLAPARAVHILAQVARALDTVHARGLVHRDVKPANILVDQNAGDFTYLVDFGIAKPVNGATAHTGTGHAIGSLDYMAPERFTTSNTDHRVDVYALAAVLHTMLTGRVPFEITNPLQAVHAHGSLPPPRPSQLRPGIDTAFDTVIAIGMAKEPDERYDSTGALAEAATHALTAVGEHHVQEPVRDRTGSGAPAAGAPTDGRPTPPQSSIPTGLGPAGPPPLPPHPSAPLPLEPPAAPDRTPTVVPWHRRRRFQVAAALALVLALAAGITTLVVTDDGAIDPPSPVAVAPLSAGQTLRIPTSGQPQGLDVSPDGRYVYVANRNTRSVSVVDTTTNARTTDIPLRGNTSEVAVHPDGRTLYVNAAGGVQVISTETRTETAFVRVVSVAGGTTAGMAVSPDGSALYVSLHLERAIVKIDTATLGLVRFPVGEEPTGIAVSRDGSTVYVANQRSNTVSVLDAAQGVAGPAIPVGLGPTSAKLSPDGEELWVVDEDTGSVTVIATDTATVTATLGQLNGPQDLAFSSDGNRVYVANYYTYSVVPYEVATRQRLPPLPAGSATQVAVAPDGSRLYATDYNGNALVVMGLARS